MTIAKSKLGAVSILSLLGALLGAGCATGEVGDELDVDSETDPIRTGNSLETLDLVANTITGNPETLATFIARPLSFGGPDHDVMRVQLHDDRAQRFMGYLVGCALTKQQSVTYVDPFNGSKKTWKGSLGLCPAWRTSAPDEACLETVSACLLARNNPNGIVVDLSLRGHGATGAALTVKAAEAALYDVVEGAFFGNLFDPAAVSTEINRTVLTGGIVRDTLSALPHGAVVYVFDRMWSCHSPTWVSPDPYHDGRVCTLEISGNKNHKLCAARPAGPCTTVCTSADGAPKLGDQDWQGCSGSDGVDDAWTNALTVFLDDPCAIVPFSFACLSNP